MRISAVKVTVYITTLVVVYTSFVYVIFNFPLFAKMTSFLRHILSTRNSKYVYGFGTVMVDVRSLGKKLADDRMLRTRNDMNSVSNKSKSRRVCFDLSLGSNRDFENNKKQTVLTNEGFAAKQFLESYNLINSFNNMENTDKRRHCKGYITIDSPPGRSGNQMFQIASLLGTAYDLDLIPVIATDFPLSKWVELPNLVDLNLTDAQIYVLKSSGKYYNDITYLNNSKNWTLRGYFQSWKYFRNADDIVRKAFRIKDDFINVAKSFIRNISRPRQRNVCVHVRRGDLSHEASTKKGYAIAGLDFIENAMNFFREKFKNVQFIVLSDGIFWCKENIKGSDIIFSPFYRYEEDMALMTQCDHVIVTSGTFGWWGAWLSGGTTVYFKGYPKPVSWLASQIDKNDYYPKDWIAMW